MKRSIISILIIALVFALTLTSCAGSKPAEAKTVRVIGTATTETRAIENKLTIASVDKVMVNGTDIKDQLVAAPGATDGQNNVVFSATVEVPSKTVIEASAKPGFVFDEWEVLDDEDCTADPALLDKIEDWLEANDLEHKEKLTNVPAEYLPYLVAEYDHGFYVTLDAPTATSEEAKGTKANPFTVDEFIASKYNDELTLVVLGTNEKELAKLIGSIKNVEELKLKAKDVKLTALPSLSTLLEEIVLSGFEFTADIEIDNASSEIKFENCKFTNLTVKNADELELKGGEATTVTILAAEEVEIKNMTIGTLDLSAMGKGEVELKNVSYTTINKPEKGAKVEIEER